MKRKRAESSSRISSTFANIDSLSPDETLTEISQHPSKPNHHISSTFHFNDSSTSDVTLRLHLETSSLDSIQTGDLNDVHLHLHSDVLRQCKYFAALLSDRWQRKDSESCHLELKVSPITSSISTHLTVLQLLYTNDFFETINTVSTALSILPVALEILFEECINACVQFLEAVPWSEEEESKILNLIPFLGQDECQKLLARVTPDKTGCLEGMLDGMILSAIKNHPNMAYVKGFVSKMLRESTPRFTVRNVLDRIFVMSLNIVKGALEEYSRPEFRGNLSETEAIQRFNLHTAMTNVRNLAWLIEMMIELKVADTAVEEWSDQPSLTADFQIAFREDAWIGIVPALPTTVLRCTLKLAAAVSSGSTLAPKAVRMNLVKNWLPVLIVCKQNVTPGNPCSKPLYQEMEETFLSIISTLPMSDAQELLQQCLSFSTRNVEDCPHLVMAFNTWFRRAARPPHLDLD